MTLIIVSFIEPIVENSTINWYSALKCMKWFYSPFCEKVLKFYDYPGYYTTSQ